jgi:hypothetical protein
MVSKREAEPVAFRFMAKGFQVFVLNYLCAPVARYPEQLLELACTVDYIRKNAEKYGLPYVRLNWIWLEHQEECSPKEGDIIYDTQGNPYPIVGEFIITHPNDKGMEYIAKAIYEKI